MEKKESEPELKMPRISMLTSQESLSSTPSESEHGLTSFDMIFPVLDSHSQDPRQESIESRRDIMFHIIAPAMQEIDMRIVSLRHVQLELAKEMERLTAELQLFLSTCDTPAIDQTVARLTLIKKRLSRTSSTLQAVESRLAKCLSKMTAKKQPRSFFKWT